MKKSLLFLLIVSFIFINGCVEQENIDINDDDSSAEIKEPPVPLQKSQKILPRSSTVPQLGNLCSGDEECSSFCLTNRGQCDVYCKGNIENELCRIIFPPKEEREQTEKLQEMMPVLKNLGVNIEPWNKETNLAGDLLFDKRVVYDDGRVAGNKVFIDFGNKDKYRINDIGSVEYWFFVPLGTKVRAPVDGVVSIGFFEHTQDWGISMTPKESQWIVSFEHLVNLNVKEGDVVKAGDVVGEAAPRINKEIAMVEFVVWTGGQNIIKYCPFKFLDESLKPMYEEKINQLAKDWEEFIGKDVYKQEDWVAPGCLLYNITER